MKYYEFLDTVSDSKMDICRRVFFEYRDKIKIKKEKTVIKNLEKIFETTLKIGIEKGFQAMTMRDLSSGSNLSMGALYSYFSSKEEILRVFLNEGRKIISQILVDSIETKKEPVQKLKTAVEVHLYLSEKMHKWFYFSFMEAKNLSPEERENAIQSELYTEELIKGILIDGHKKGIFKPKDHSLAASVIKAMLQDWYLKRGKYSRRNIGVDQYAEFIMTFINSFYLKG
jgi:TetR/AcrR family transcriptional regulator, cholesterol catabolism regulator